MSEGEGWGLVWRNLEEVLWVAPKPREGMEEGGLELDFEPRKTPGEVVVAEEGEIRKGDWIFVLPKKSSYILACIP